MSLKASPGIIAFWNACKIVSVPTHANEVVRFPAGTPILGDERFGDAIFVRACYLPLADKIFGLPECYHAIILGTPGIGKTYFGYYLLCILAQRGATVIYEDGPRQRRLLFSGDCVRDGNLGAFSEYLWKPDTFYIVDASKPVGYKCRTVLITSPEHEQHWYSFSKLCCRLFYMPICSLAELQSMARQLQQPELDRRTVEMRFDLFGGIPRFVLAQCAADYDTFKWLLAEAFLSVNLDALAREGPAFNVHMLVHMAVSVDFMTYTYRFASDDVADEIYRRYNQHKRNKLLAFVATSYENTFARPLCIQLFGLIAHEMLANGGTFAIREHCADEEKFDMMLPKCETVTFVDNIVIDKTNRYYRLQSSESAVDAMMAPNKLFQIAYSQNHPVKQAGLQNAIKVLGSPSNIELYFVVPQDQFESFKPQSYHEPVLDNVNSLKQFVLAINLNE
jgi:hypothetical protein